MKTYELILNILVIVALSIMLGIIFGSAIQRNKMEQSAIKNGVGFYNPTNANFEFLNLNVNEK